MVIQRQDPRLGDPVQLTRTLARLKRAQATAVAVAQPPDASGVPAALRSAGARFGIPLLSISDEPAHWLVLHRALTQEHHAKLVRTTGLQREVLDQIHHLGQPDGTQRIVGWLASALHVHAAVVCPGSVVTAAAPADAQDLLRPVHGEIAKLADGNIRSAALDAGGRQVRLFTIGDLRPAPVLALTAPAFPLEANSVVARVLDLLAAQSAVEKTTRAGARLGQGEAAVRQAVLQLLMTGHTTDAQRTAAGIAPGVLDTEECRVFVLKASSRADRPAVIQQCQNAVGASALVSACPAFPDEVIVVAPCRSTDHDVLDGLTEVAQDAPRRFLGGSCVHRLADTNQAYLDASRALTVARRVPSRVHLYITEIQLAHVLDVRAWSWSQTYLAPLLGLAEDRRGHLLSALRLGLDFQPAAAARILGTHRNTVARRLGEAADLLGADLQDIGHRAVLGLALEIRSRRLHRVQPDTDPVGINQLLDTDEVRRWAEQFLQPLRTDRKPLLTTLAAWARANTHVETAAVELDMNAATVRSHLRDAERLLQRRLLIAAPCDADTEPDIAGAHDVVLALATLCDDIVRI
ncbi:helix-turn-helix domain-containing protein [Kitasatospora purpeofusca]|uniref:helix-turn-helix domain-containing protein n=1 Tax=Kitasatospora purpeofusca TaxID=67352 RepID=UPI0035DEEF02